MPYNFVPAVDPMNIDEREYGSAAAILFSRFTYCIGVIARGGNQLTAVHLAAVEPDGTRFNGVTASRGVLDFFANKYEEVMIVGCLNVWTNPVSQVLPAYENFLAQIRSLQLVQLYLSRRELMVRSPTRTKLS